MVKRYLRKYVSNILGASMHQKIVVLESDDWGSTRFPNLATINKFKKSEYNIDLCGFSRYDCLESNKDLELLFNSLSSFKDGRGNHPILTLLNLTSNPDYAKIADSGFESYFGEPLPVTLMKYPDHDKVLSLYNEGITNKLIEPQFHGREHLYVDRWLRQLKAGNKDVLFAFNYGISGISPIYANKITKGFRAAFDLDEVKDIESEKNILKQGVKQFESLYGYPPSYFVPPDGFFNNTLESVIGEIGIKYIGTAKIQVEPLGSGRTKKHLRWLGKKNKWGQYYITRNVIFEPMSTLNADNVSSALEDVSIAFKCKKPAVISTHRANYVGTIDEKNRENGLKQLRILLKSIINRWPDVMFMTSKELGDLISKTDHKFDIA